MAVNPIRQLKAPNNNFNKRTHIIHIDNDKIFNQYTHDKGTTALFNALMILSRKKSTEEMKAKAIEDLIIIRFILSGIIKFKVKRSEHFPDVFDMIFGKIDHINPLPLVDHNIDDLLRDLHKNPNKVPKVLVNSIKEVLEPELLPHIVINDLTTISVLLVISGPLLVTLFITSFMTLTTGYLIARTDQNKMEKIQNSIIKLIDIFLSINEEIFSILNNHANIPELFKNDEEAIILYNRYIRDLNKIYKSRKAIDTFKRLRSENPDEYEKVLKEAKRLNANNAKKLENLNEKVRGPVIAMNNFLKGSNGVGGGTRKRRAKSKQPLPA